MSRIGQQWVSNYTLSNLISSNGHLHCLSIRCTYKTKQLFRAFLATCKKKIIYSDYLKFKEQIIHRFLQGFFQCNSHIPVHLSSRFKEWMADNKCKEVVCSVCSHKDGKGRMDGTYQQVYTRSVGKKWVFLLINNLF